MARTPAEPEIAAAVTVALPDGQAVTAGRGSNWCTPARSISQIGASYGLATPPRPHFAAAMLSYMPRVSGITSRTDHPSPSRWRLSLNPQVRPGD